MEYIFDDAPTMETACCRVCLTKTGEFFELFSGELLEEGATIAQILRECTSYSVESKDNLSHQICRACLDNACFAYSFRRQADESYRYLCGIMGQPQKSTMMLCETGTQTDNGEEPTENPFGHSIFSISGATDNDGDDNMSLLEPIERKPPRQRTNKVNITTDCKLCGTQYERLLQLREHLMAEHMFAELTCGLQCRLCEKEYSRKDHLVRHLRNIHKVSRDREHGGITIEEPQTSTMGQWVHSDSESFGETSVRIKTEPDVKFKPKASSTTVHRYWHTPEFVRSGNHTHTYKVKVSKHNYGTYDDPLNDDATSMLEVDEENIESVLPDIDDDDDDLAVDIKPSTHQHGSSSMTRYKAVPAANQAAAKRSDKSEMIDRPNFQCDICERTFFRKYHLQRHKLIHSKVRAYNCEVCKRSFARSDQITRHRKEGCKLVKRQATNDL